LQRATVLNQITFIVAIKAKGIIQMVASTCWNKALGVAAKAVLHQSLGF